jgi:hypothetical protein
MAITDSIKRAPRWAWFTVGGVTLGVVAIRVWQGRDNEEDLTPDADVNGVPVLTTSSPSPVITPPVIIQGGSGDNGALAELVGSFVGTFGSSFDNLVGVVGGVTTGQQELLGTIVTGQQDINKALIANGGSAPQPVTQAPPIQVTITAPPPSPALPVPGPAPILCPPSFPNGTPPNCYANCAHCEKSNAGKPYRNHGHCYQSGRRVHVNNEYPGGCK